MNLAFVVKSLRIILAFYQDGSSYSITTILKSHKTISHTSTYKITVIREIKAINARKELPSFKMLCNISGDYFLCKA